MEKISIILLTYNSELEKIYITLESILRQNFKQYEIIISDDGSKVDNFQLIQNYLKNRCFYEYRFIKNNVNKGTVENLLGAAKQANGIYIKAIGPGDLLYEDNSLQEIIDFIEMKSGKIVYGKMQSYHIQKPSLSLFYNKFTAPKQSGTYDGKRQNEALKSMLIKGDWISGATMVFEKFFLVSKLSILSGIVQYCEDLVQVLACLDGEKIHYLPKTIIWYEYGEGISTGGSSDDRLINDHIRFNTFLKSAYSNNKIVMKAYKNIRLRSEKNTVKRKILVLFYNPAIVFYRIKLKIISRLKKSINTKDGFLNDAEFKKVIKNLYEEKI